MSAYPTQIRPGQTALVFRSAIPETARILAFHGGGGVGGSPDMLVPFCTVLGDSIPGLSIMVAGYRTLNRDKATLEQMLEDATFALDWCRSDLPARSELFVLGASFGGLLALDAVFKAPRDVSGLILLNPVADIARGGFANRVISPDGRPEHSPMQRWSDWPGMTQLRCLIAHGSADDVVPIATSERFSRLWPKGRCRFVDYPGAGHGFFNLPVNSPSVAQQIRNLIATDGQASPLA